MACKFCDHTMQLTYGGFHRRTYWCPRCGALQEVLPIGENEWRDRWTQTTYRKERDLALHSAKEILGEEKPCDADESSG